MPKRILIAGASIAGPTLAFWLHRLGFEVVVAERAPSLRLGGQNIDVKGQAQKIAGLMGIEDAIRQAHTGEKGVLFVNKYNNVRGAFPQGNAGGLTSELEIVRGDLVEILYNCTKDSVAYRFGDFITGLEDKEEAVEVTFESGKTENFDLVIAADGISSRTRQLIFGAEVKLKFLKLYTTYLTIPKAQTDSKWARWHNAIGRKVFIYRPDRQGTTRASFTFWSDEPKYHDLTDDEEKQVLKEKLQGAEWESDRIVRELDKNDDVYFGPISQVQAPRWSKGRLVMVGDAAYCPTPLTGMGTSLAMIGAYVLAGELARHNDHNEAFAAYEKLLRPYVESVQSLPPGVPRLAYPNTKIGVVFLNRMIGIVASAPVQFLFKAMSAQGKKDKPEEEFVLPDYDNIQKC